MCRGRVTFRPFSSIGASLSREERSLIFRQLAKSRRHQMILLDYRAQNGVRLDDLLLRGEIVLNIC